MSSNKLYIVFVSLALPSLMLSCKSNSISSSTDNNSSEFEPFHYDSLNVEEIKELIIGKWEWIHSIKMSRNLQPPDNTISPESAGYTIQRIFESNDKVSFFKDNLLTETLSYEIKKFKVLPDDEGFVTEIYFDENPSQLLFSHPDTMMIGNGWIDGIDDYFVRSSNY